MLITAKQLAGYQKARNDARRLALGGITYNDEYNRAAYGIEQATHNVIHKALQDAYGMDMPDVNKLTVDGVNRLIK